MADLSDDAAQAGFRQSQHWWLEVMQKTVVTEYGGSMETTGAVLARERAALKQAALQSGKVSEHDTTQYPRALPTLEPAEVDRLRGELARLAAQNEAYRVQLREARNSMIEDRAVAAPNRDSEDKKASALEAEVTKLKNTIAELEAARFEPPELEELQILSGTLEAEKQELQAELERMFTAKCEAEKMLVDSRENASKVKSLQEQVQLLEAHSEQHQEALAKQSAEEVEALQRNLLLLKNNLEAAQLRADELESAAKLLAPEKERSKELQAELEDVKAELAQRMKAESLPLQPCESNVEELQEKIHHLELDNSRLSEQASAILAEQLASRAISEAAHDIFQDLQENSSSQEVGALPVPEDHAVTKTDISAPEKIEHEMQDRLQTLELENEHLIDAARTSRADELASRTILEAMLEELNTPKARSQLLDSDKTISDQGEDELQKTGMDPTENGRAALLEAELDELRNRCNELEIENCKLRQLEDSLMDLQDGSEHTRNQLTLENEELQQKCKVLENQVELLQSTKDMEPELHDLRKRCHDMAIENEQLHQLQDSLLDGEDKLHQVASEKEELQHKCKVLEEEVENLLQSSKATGLEVDNLQKRCHDLELRNSELCQLQDSLAMSNNDSEHKLNKLALDNEELREKCKALEDQVERQILHMQELQTATPATPLGSRHLQVPDSPSMHLPSSQEISPGSTKITAVSPPLTSRIPDGNIQGSELPWQIDSPGVYSVTKTVALTTGQDKKSGKIQNLPVGMIVNILEVAYIQDAKRIRGRVQDPEGWISITSPEDADMRWAVRDLHKSNLWAVSQAEQIKMLTRSLEAAEETASAKTFPAVAETDTSELDEVKARAAEDLARTEREVSELRTRLRALENTRREDALQIDSPGVYRLACDVDVFEGPAKGSQKVERLPAGSCVDVLEIVHRLQDRRVRGRIESPAAGWISLLDTSEGHRWACRELDATNEWISALRDEASRAQVVIPAQSNANFETRLATDSDAQQEVLELRARSAAVEAHRDSLLLELDQVQSMQQAVGDDDGAAPHSAADLHDLRARIFLLEAEKEEMSIHGELLRARNAALEAELEDLGSRTEEALLKCEQAETLSAVSRGRALQAEELQRQIAQHLAERGMLDAELARLRAENRVLAADAQGKLSSTAFSSSQPAGLTDAERCVLYGESPNVAKTSSCTYMDKYCVDFDDEHLMNLMAPLAAVNSSGRSSAIAAVESGDFTRKAFKAYLEEDKMQKGYLEYDGGGIRQFISKAFQKQGLTPPLETHILSVYRLFDPDPARGHLDAHACLCLADALLRGLLRAGDSNGPHALQARLAAAERTAEQAVLGHALGPPVVPRIQDASVPNGLSRSEHAFSMASQCPQCGNVYAQDSSFCGKCGAPRHHVQIPTVAVKSCNTTAGAVPPDCFRQAPDGHLPTNANAARQIGNLSHFQPQERQVHQMQQPPHTQQQQPRSQSVSRQLSVPLIQQPAQQQPQQGPKVLDPTRVTSVVQSSVASPGLRPPQVGQATTAAATQRAHSFEPVTGPARKVLPASAALPQRQLEVFESAG